MEHWCSCPIWCLDHTYIIRWIFWIKMCALMFVLSFIYSKFQCEHVKYWNRYLKLSSILLFCISSFYSKMNLISPVFTFLFISTILNLTMTFYLLQFINHLVNQLARHQFLKIACQMERRTILGAYSLVKVIESELEGYLSAGNGRLVCKHMLTVFSMICTCPSFYSVSVT